MIYITCLFTNHHIKSHTLTPSHSTFHISHFTLTSLHSQRFQLAISILHRDWGPESSIFISSILYLSSGPSTSFWPVLTRLFYPNPRHPRSLSFLQCFTIKAHLPWFTITRALNRQRDLHITQTEFFITAPSGIIGRDPNSIAPTRISTVDEKSYDHESRQILRRVNNTCCDHCDLETSISQEVAQHGDP